MAENVPTDRRYTKEHEWVLVDGDVVVIGITDFAQDQLGDVVYVDLPAAGAEVDDGQPFGEVESTKSVSDLFAPLAGTVVERNEALDEQPEMVNDDPYGTGWMVRLTPSDPASVEALMDAAAYAELITG